MTVQTTRCPRVVGASEDGREMVLCGAVLPCADHAARLSANDVAAMRRNLAALNELGDAVGEWTDKIDARQTGVSIHLRFEKRVDPMLAARFATVMQNSTSMLANALEQLLRLDDSGVHGGGPAAGVRSCRLCGCTDDRACAGGCSWVDPDLCSACA